MKRAYRVLTMTVIAAVAGGLSLYLANWYIANLTDETARATVAAGEITLFGVIFSAFYKEVDSYYAEKSTNLGKKWELIFPLLKKYYYPLIHVAGDSMKGTLERMGVGDPSEPSVTRYLYLTAVFYGIRYNWIVDDGGIVLLSTTKDEEAVEKTYHDLELALNWAGDDTPMRVSYLQSLWRRRTVPAGGPYTESDFEKDLEEDRNLQDDLRVMRGFLKGNAGYKKNAIEAIDAFVTAFEGSVNGLYDAWSES